MKNEVIGRKIVLLKVRASKPPKSSVYLFLFEFLNQHIDSTLEALDSFLTISKHRQWSFASENSLQVFTLDMLIFLYYKSQ